MPFEKVETQVDFPAQERAVLKFWERTGAFEALRQKVSLLQDTISLINEMRKGNNAAAAQLVNKS